MEGEIFKVQMTEKSTVLGKMYIEKGKGQIF